MVWQGFGEGEEDLDIAMVLLEGTVIIGEDGLRAAVSIASLDCRIVETTVNGDIEKIGACMGDV